MTSIIESYFPAQTNAPFSSYKEEREQFLLFLDLLCILSVQQAENHKEEAVSRVGALLSDEDLMRAIEPHKRVVFPQKEEVRKIYDALLLRAKNTVENAGATAPISRLFSSGLFSPLEQLGFCLSFSVHVSKKYSRMYAHLLGGTSESQNPTLGLCLDFGRLFLSDKENDVGVLLDDTSYFSTVFLSKDLYSPSPFLHEKDVLSRPLVLKDSVYKWLMDAPCDDELLLQIGEFLTPAEDTHFVCHEDTLGELLDVCSYTTHFPDRASSVLELSGPDGCGKRFLLSKVSAITYMPIFAVDAIRLMALSETEKNRIVDELCVREALFGVSVYLYHVSGCEEKLYSVVTALLRFSDMLFIGCSGFISDDFYRGMPKEVYRIRVPEVDASLQRKLWEEAADRYSAVFSEELDLRELVSKYTMSPGRIFHAMQNAAGVAKETKDGFVVEKKNLESQIRKICSVGFGESAKKISTPFTWEDLIIEEESKNMLRMAMNRIRFKSMVNDEFGFGEKLPYGRGVSIVLYGPPGTGKTMAAGVLARELGLDLYRIDLSQISSKYIGETEKNLGAVFDAATNSNVILFFDEADSVFARRTDVSSSNDRHANEQTGYLLQRIEEYPGISILATNNMQNFDAAFKRRMTYLIPIGIPDEGTREMLWEKAFPKNAPLGNDVDFKVLARATELSGSAIKSASLQAAYLAAAKGQPITMDDIATAVDLECIKVGRLGAKNDILSAMLKTNS